MVHFLHRKPRMTIPQINIGPAVTGRQDHIFPKKVAILRVHFGWGNGRGNKPRARGTCKVYGLFGGFMRFPKMGVSPKSSHFSRVFPYKPSSYWDTPILGHAHVVLFVVPLRVSYRVSYRFWESDVPFPAALPQHYARSNARFRMSEFMSDRTPES